VDDLRWFAPNRYCTLPVPALRRAGLAIALDGDAPAGAAVAADGQCAVAAFEYSLRAHCPLLVYLWDLPPWRLGRGKPDFIFELGGRLQRIPRLLARYPERAGSYSRIRFAAQRATLVWSPSENTVGDVRARFGIEAERVPFCYDSDRFCAGSGACGVGSGDPQVILSISRLVPHKNHRAILRAAARLTTRPVVRLIGQGPEAEPLRRLAGTLDVRLDLTDTWASDRDIVDAYRGADLVVAPSRFEGFGLTPMEGLAMGLPVIASDIPPHREFLNGAVHFFPPDDDLALAHQLAAVLSSPTVPTVATVLTVLSDLTIDACARRFLPGLERLLRSRG
jgi:glycosyltransferase involved in cell wall biosynthesis